MSLLHLEPLSPRVTKGAILHLVVSVGGIAKASVGIIELQGRSAVVEVPGAWVARLVKNLDGAELDGRRLRVWSSGGAVRADDHFGALLSLLDLESRAEAQQLVQRVRALGTREAEASGYALVDLVVRESYPGLGGRTLLALGKQQQSTLLPWTRLAAGSPVVLSAQADRTDQGSRGVVIDREDHLVRVAFNDPPDQEDAEGLLRLDIAPDEASRLRQRQALERARTAERDRLATLRDLLLGTGEPTFGEPQEFEFLDSGLNDSQRQAIQFALSADDLAIIHGPPGTGKTTTLVEIVRQAVRRGDRVLVCAPSNLAVDNVLERLLAHNEPALRVGHPARVLPTLREHTLDLLVHDHADARNARKLYKQAFALFRQAGKWTRGKPEPGARGEMRREGRALIADARKLETQAVERVLDSARVLCCTLTGLDSEVVGQRQFDLLVIDEACQSTEPACWIPLQRATRVILAGDPCQLPPTVLSQEASEKGFSVSMLERLLHVYGDRITRMLTVQYRMHEQIMAFSSREFYDEALLADASVQGHLLTDLPDIVTTPLTEGPVTFLDTAGAGYEEELEPDGESRLNRQEAALVVRKVRELLDAGLTPTAIGVITPYAAQVRLLREEMPLPGLEIDSVDGFQGREKEAIVLSMVRSNSEGEIGFLADVRRTNVALTRARRKLLVVGDSATLSVLPFYARLIEYCESIGAYHTVWEEF